MKIPAVLEYLTQNTPYPESVKLYGLKEGRIVSKIWIRLPDGEERVTLPMKLPFILDLDDFQLRVVQHFPADGSEEELELRGAVLPRQQVYRAVQVLLEDRVPPPREGQGSDGMTVGHLAQFHDALFYFSTFQVGRLVVGNVAGGVVSPSGKKAE